jgi:hypothetical protein
VFKKFPVVMESEGSVPSSQKAGIEFHSASLKSVSQPHILFGIHLATLLSRQLGTYSLEHIASHVIVLLIFSKCTYMLMKSMQISILLWILQ